MADDNKSGLSEVTEKSANAANAIRGAIKTGKAVAAASKGAAVGGPYGAVAGALWANRKHLGKIIIAIVALLMIPILIIVMLPAMIFSAIGGFFSGIFGGGGSTEPVSIMNDNAAIIENIQTVNSSLNVIMLEGLDDLYIRIDNDFAASSGDRKEVINPYDGATVMYVNLIISQFCAAHAENIDNITLAELERTVRANKSALFSYTKRTETESYTVTDPETEEETTVYETVIYYTVVYNGDAHFADAVFFLTDEQKALAQDYAQNLSIFMDDGMYQHLSGSDYIVGPSYEGVTFTDGQTQVTYYNQLDSRWARTMYGTSSTIGQGGCGPTSMAIVISTLTGQAHDPVEMANWSVENGYRCEGNGSYHALIPESAKAFGLAVEGAGINDAQKIVDALASGKLVVAIMTKGHFTSGGHFIVLRGVTSDGKILVADPASYSRSEKQWELSLIMGEASKTAGAGGPFWIISPP